jgi:hypothetical protein
MVWNKRFVSLLPLVAVLALAACKVSFQFNGASINYDKVKTIQLDNFPIRSAYVYSPMGPVFNNRLSDVYANQTKLRQVKRGGDMVITGEIVGYDQYNKGISADGYSSQTELKMTVNVRYTNNTNHKEDFERQFSAVADYDSSRQLVAVQDELITQMVKDIVDQIFNATVANW